MPKLLIEVEVEKPTVFVFTAPLPNEQSTVVGVYNRNLTDEECWSEFRKCLQALYGSIDTDADKTTEEKIVELLNQFSADQFDVVEMPITTMEQH